MSPGVDAGSVRLRVCHDGDKVVSAETSCLRPPVARALRGRLADEAASLVPLVFVLCGRAQGVAAQLAIAAARGVEARPYLDATIEREVMREHLWRWLLDLPALFGMRPFQLRDQFLAAVRALDAGDGATLRALLAAPEILALTQRLNELEQPAQSTQIGAAAGGTALSTDFRTTGAIRTDQASSCSAASRA
jgi:hypothetical protein